MTILKDREHLILHDKTNKQYFTSKDQTTDLVNKYWNKLLPSISDTDSVTDIYDVPYDAANID